MSMKENQNGTSFDSTSLGKEIDDPLTFGSKDIGNGTVDSPKKAGQTVITHHLSMDSENGKVDSPTKYGLSHQLSICDKDADSLSSDSTDIDKEVEEFVDCNGSESKNSSSLLFTDKNVLDCNRPELEICYKEIDCQISKDICCVDEGRPQKDVHVIESYTDENPGQPPNEIDHLEAKGDSCYSSTANQCGSKKENDGKSEMLDNTIKKDKNAGEDFGGQSCVGLEEVPAGDDPIIQCPSNKSQIPTSEAMGETSFSAASTVAYSGPIAFSGSLSHRSDGSTTSGKSFAFPTLQSEWNSSPVRMAEADRRHFRKHKGWRSGILCCRF